MAATSLVQLRGYINNLPAGSKGIAPTDLQNIAAPTYEDQIVLASGDNSFAVPALARGVIIVFDSTSVTVKKLKGIGGDTGLTVGKVGWCVLTFDTTPMASFIINSGAVDTGKYTTITFF